MRTRKSWREKLNNPDLPKLVPIPPGMFQNREAGILLVPSPKEVDAYIRTVEEGSLTTVSEIRIFLARKYLADSTCPLTTGIFIRIAAEAAEEDAGQGATEITPYWRVVKDDGSLNPKFPGGVARQAEKLRAEGHRIVKGSGKKPPRVLLEPR